MNTNTEYHNPVLLSQSIEGLAIKPEGTYLDATLGGGGHFREIVRALGQNGTAIGIDRDPEAIRQVRQTLTHATGTIIIEQARFSEADMVLRRHSIDRVDGILLDLGISSHQIDTISRGFNYLSDAPLDMRMDPADTRTAADILNASPESELSRILADFGEVQNPQRMARTLKSAAKELATAADLRRCLENEYGPNIRVKVLAKVFQALRIAVNGELTELQAFMSKVADLLSTGGRLVIISYHSLEDRIVKNCMREWEEGSPVEPENPFGPNQIRVSLFKRITKKAIQAPDQEVEGNRRSRSARLRVAERLALV